MSTKCEKYDIKLYLSEKEPICREERQYALFLFNMLQDLVGESQDLTRTDYEWVFSLLQIDKGISEIHLLHVAYEATYMRDYFENERFKRIEKQWEASENMREKVLRKRVNLYGYSNVNLKDENNREIQAVWKQYEDSCSFNCALLFKYLWLDSFEWVEEEMPCFWKYANMNFGDIGIYTNNQVNLENENDNIRNLVNTARAMMKSKPDITILYEQEEQYYLKFLECKYLSEESKKNGNGQVDIQNKICQFLCEYILDYGGKEIKAKDTALVRFISELNRSTYSSKSDEIKVEISDIMRRYIK